MLEGNTRPVIRESCSEEAVVGLSPQGQEGRSQEWISQAERAKGAVVLGGNCLGLLLDQPGGSYSQTRLGQRAGSGRRGGQTMQSPLNLGEEFGSYLEVVESFKKGMM